MVPDNCALFHETNHANLKLSTDEGCRWILSHDHRDLPHIDFLSSPGFGNLAKWLPHKYCKESVAFTLSINRDLTIYGLSVGDLDIECLGVHATESLDVRVATNIVKMKRKKFARNMSSKSNSARSTSSSGLCLILSFFGIKEFCRPCSCRRLARIFVVGLNFLLSLVQLDDPYRCTPT